MRRFSRTYKFVLNLTNLHVYLRSAKQRYKKQVFIVQVIKIADL